MFYLCKIKQAYIFKMSIAISATLAGLSITEAYESDECLTHLLKRVNIAANERTRINSEGFNNLKSLIDNFAPTKTFEDTIKDLKMFWSSSCNQSQSCIF